MAAARLLVGVVLFAAGGQGWWNASTPSPPDPPKAWWRELLDDRFPRILPWVDYAVQGTEKASWWAAEAQSQGLNWGLWTLADTLVSFLGRTFFGSAWAGVRNGCKRLFQGCVILSCCIVAHYIWVVCWPVASLLCAVVMTIVWLARFVCWEFACTTQKWLGGTPEETMADYYGPGTGQVPETSELRKFKYHNSQEKWVIIKRSNQMAVFKVSSEVAPIRSSGVYVGIEVDTLRGSPSLLQELLGTDKVHLCRNDECSEPGHLSKPMTKKVDFEDFDLHKAN